MALARRGLVGGALRLGKVGAESGVLSWVGVGEKPLPAVKLIGLPKVQVGVLLILSLTLA